MIDYQISIKSAPAHIFEISCHVSAPAAAGQRFSLPVWTPGSYLIREFSKHVLSVRAEAGGRALTVKKIDKHTWQCAASAEPITFVYEIYAFDLSVRGAYLDTTRAFFNGASVLVWPHGREREPCSLQIAAPESSAAQTWRVATSMALDSGEERGFGRYRAADYDELIDHPVEISDFVLCSFTVRDIPHQVAITGRQDADLARLTSDLSRICEEHIRLFGEAPFSRYLFQLLIVADGYGGLEHRASTSLIASRKTLPNKGDSEQSDDYRTLLGLFSHEYFHAWNVKRIKPAVFMPYNLSGEVYTDDLWLYEGITSYYDDLALVRCGVIEPAAYLELLGQTVTRVLRGSGRHRQSVAESSFDAWIKFYRPDENVPNALVSYYAKGSLIALALDLTLRRETAGRSSLDDLMRVLWARFGKPAVGVPEGTLESLVIDLAGEAAAAFLHRAVFGRQDLPLDELLRDVAIAYQLRAAESSEDKGGKPAKSTRARCSFGARAEGKTDPKLVHVFDGGAAQRAGLAPGDQLLAIDGLRISNGLDKTLLQYRAGQTLRVHAFRRDELIETELLLQEAPLDTCYLLFDTDASPAALQRRAEWLSNAGEK